MVLVVLTVFVFDPYLFLKFRPCLWFGFDSGLVPNHYVFIFSFLKLLFHFWIILIQVGSTQPYPYRKLYLFFYSHSISPFLFFSRLISDITTFGSQIRSSAIIFNRTKHLANISATITSDRKKLTYTNVRFRKKRTILRLVGVGDQQERKQESKNKKKKKELDIGVGVHRVVGIGRKQERGD